MKNKTIYLCIALAVISFLSITAFSAHTENKKYEHLFIVSENPDLDGVFCSEDGKDYTRYNYDKDVKAKTGNLNPLINLIHDYEAQGWELMNVELNSPKGSHGFWLRRVKN